MATMDELLQALRNPGEDGVPDTIYDDIAETYNHEITVRDSKISELDQAVIEREAEISKLKSANYDLMMSQSVSEDEGEESGDSDSEETEVGIDDLFE